MIGRRWANLAVLLVAIEGCDDGKRHKPDTGVSEAADGGNLGECPVCPAHATCQTVESQMQCVCEPGYLPDAGGCFDVAAELGGLRWDLPCAGPAVGDGCAASPAVLKTMTLGGGPDVVYDVTLRFRGVVEYVTVTGGQASGIFCVNGQPELVGYNTYSLRVSAPQANYYLNAGHSGPRRCFPIDYTRTIPMNGGAVITLVGDPVDTAQIINIDGDGGVNIVPDVAPAPAAFNGQFIQMDVISVIPR